MPPIDPASAAEFLGLIKTLGLGVSVLFFWLWHEISQRKEIQKQQALERKEAAEAGAKHAKDLLDISKENISTIGSLVSLVETIAPAVASSSQQIRGDIERSIIHFKDHVSSTCKNLETLINSQKGPHA